MPRPRLPAPCLTRRRWTIEDARSALAAWKASGLSLRAFALREGVDVYRLYRSRRRLAGEAVTAQPTPEFVELRPRGAEPVELVLRSGRVLRFSETIDPSVLGRLVAVLERTRPC